MRAPLMTVIRVAKEVAYGVDTMSAVYHGRRPAAPPYPKVAVHTVPFPGTEQAMAPQPQPQHVPKSKAIAGPGR